MDTRALSQARLLIVDDEPDVVELIRASLESVGYEVTSATDGRQALEMAETEMPDLIILDIMLPGLDGYEVCRRIREFSAVPIIMLTARSAEVDLVRGFDAGADDYLTKPFAINELLARVKAVLRRSKFPDEIVNRPALTAGEVTIDFARRRVTVRGREVKLSPTEYRLLSLLASNAGRVMLHQELLRRVWGPEYREATEYLRVYVRYLRQKIEREPAHPQFILTQPGVGYMFNTPEKGIDEEAQQNY